MIGENWTTAEANDAFATLESLSHEQLQELLTVFEIDFGGETDDEQMIGAILADSPDKQVLLRALRKLVAGETAIG